MKSIPRYDEWKTTPPEQEPATYCDCCGCELQKEIIFTQQMAKACVKIA